MFLELQLVQEDLEDHLFQQLQEFLILPKSKYVSNDKYMNNLEYNYEKTQQLTGGPGGPGLPGSPIWTHH